MLKKMMNKIESIFEPYELDTDYNIMIADTITGQSYSISDWIKALDDRIQNLEDELVWTKSELNRLNEENISTTNGMYEIANSIEARIDIFAEDLLNYKEHNT